jgi:triosephosphate isomerase
MTEILAGPFFEIGPKNFLRRAPLEVLARTAGDAGRQFDVRVVVTVPTALIAPIAELRSGVLVFAQGMDVDLPGASVGRVTAESLIDAGADGVMLNHDSNPLDYETLTLTLARARDVGLLTIVAAGTAADAVRFAALKPTAILFEPPQLIGTVGTGERNWIANANAEVKRAHPTVLMMHAGGVGTPAIAGSIMRAGADATGSTSGVLNADDPGGAAGRFIEATRSGWDEAHSDIRQPKMHDHEGERA